MFDEPIEETPGNKRAIATVGLPPLSGTTTDVARANEIRTRILIEADDVLTRLRSDETITEAQLDTDIVSPRQVNTEQVHAAEVALNRLRSQTDAGWWLKQADATAGSLIGELMAGGEP